MEAHGLWRFGRTPYRGYAAVHHRGACAPGEAEAGEGPKQTLKIANKCAAAQTRRRRAWHEGQCMSTLAADGAASAEAASSSASTQFKSAVMAPLNPHVVAYIEPEQRGEHLIMSGVSQLRRQFQGSKLSRALGAMARTVTLRFLPPQRRGALVQRAPLQRLRRLRCRPCGTVRWFG